MSVTSTFGNLLINHVYRNVTFPSPSSLWLGLFTEAPNSDGSGGVEVSGPGYARVSLQGRFGAPSGGVSLNSSRISFSQSLGSWGTIVGIGVYSDPTGGSLYQFSKLVSPIAVEEIGTVVTFPVGTVSNVFNEPQVAVISDWEDRKPVNQDYTLIYGPTGASYRYHEGIGEWIRDFVYYQIQSAVRVARLSGNFSPMSEPNGGWTEAHPLWTVFNDGTYNWTRINNPINEGSDAFASFTYDEGVVPSMLGVGYFFVPTFSGTSAQRAGFWMEDTHDRGDLSLSGDASGRIGFIGGSASLVGTYFFDSDCLTSPAWVEAYKLRTGPTTFQYFIAVNHGVPSVFQDVVRTSSTLLRIRFGDMSGVARSDFRARDVTFAAMTLTGYTP
jgi:hypothetical protein